MTNEEIIEFLEKLIEDYRAQIAEMETQIVYLRDNRQFYSQSDLFD